MAKKRARRQVAAEQEKRRAKVDHQVRSVIAERGHDLSRVENRGWATYRCAICGGLIGIYAGKKPIVRVSPRLDDNCSADLVGSKELGPARDLQEFGIEVSAS